MIRKKNITLNNTKALGSEILQEGDKIKLFLAEETIIKFVCEKQHITNHKLTNHKPKISIAYEDENILIAIKPKGQLSHPAHSHNTEKKSLIYDILGYLQLQGELNQKFFTPALANRLDRNTTGLVLCGKTLPALQALNNAVSGQNLQKYYVAVVCGQIKKSGTLTGYHTKDNEKNTVKITTDGAGDKIITKYEPIKVYEKFTYIKLQLVTGKPHQLRAHMEFIGHPILGDPKYANKKMNVWALKKFNLKSQLLHAQSIVFGNGITGLEYLQGKVFTAPLPQEFKNILGNFM